MAARKTVQIVLERVLSLAREAGWSAATLARRVGKHERWFSEIKRGKNLPSPEEAARMCAILQTAPEEILVEPEDIELVRRLIEREREKQSIKKERPVQDGTLSPEQQAAWELLQKMDDATLRRFIRAAKAMLEE